MQLFRLWSVHRIKFLELYLATLQLVPDQSSKSWNRAKRIVPVTHDILDVTIAAIAGIAAVSVFFPIYVVVTLAKTVVRGGKRGRTIATMLPRAH
jgi:hypothetical protein